MAFTPSSSDTGIDRKELRRPDDFLAAISGFFSNLLGHSRGVMAILGVFLAIGLMIALFFNHRASHANAARNALYLAEKAVIADMKKLAKPADPKAKPALGAASADSASLESLVFKKIDVDSQLSEGVSLLKKVDQEYSGTISAYRAQVKLGHMYFNHGEFEKALPWIEKAVKSAPGSMEKAMAYYSLGNVRENLGKTGEAVQDYQKALNLGEASLKGELLLAIARNYETLDLAKARSSYDQILADLPNTEYSKLAEIYKNKLKAQ